MWCVDRSGMHFLEELNFLNFFFVLFHAAESKGSFEPLTSTYITARVTTISIFPSRSLHKTANSNSCSLLPSVQVYAHCFRLVPHRSKDDFFFSLKFTYKIILLHLHSCKFKILYFARYYVRSKVYVYIGAWSRDTLCV